MVRTSVKLTPFPKKPSFLTHLHRQTNSRCRPLIPLHLPLRSSRPSPNRASETMERPLLLHVDVRPTTNASRARLLPRRPRLHPPIHNNHPLPARMVADHAARMDEHRRIKNGEVPTPHATLSWCHVRVVQKRELGGRHGERAFGLTCGGAL